jgi:hypothetical protein
VGVTLAVGYLVVPRRRRMSEPSAEMLAELAKQSRLAAMADLPTKSNGGRVLAFVGSLALRGVASYVSQQAGKYFTPPVAKPKQDDQPWKIEFSITRRRHQTTRVRKQFLKDCEARLKAGSAIGYVRSESSSKCIQWQASAPRLAWGFF